jgi:hypothetical protein
LLSCKAQNVAFLHRVRPFRPQTSPGPRIITGYGATANPRPFRGGPIRLPTRRGDCPTACRYRFQRAHGLQALSAGWAMEPAAARHHRALHRHADTRAVRGRGAALVRPGRARHRAGSMPAARHPARPLPRGRDQRVTSRGSRARPGDSPGSLGGLRACRTDAPASVGNRPGRDPARAGPSGLHRCRTAPHPTGRRDGAAGGRRATRVVHDRRTLERDRGHHAPRHRDPTERPAGRRGGRSLRGRTPGEGSLAAIRASGSAVERPRARRGGSLPRHRRLLGRRRGDGVGDRVQRVASESGRPRRHRRTCCCVHGCRRGLHSDQAQEAAHGPAGGHRDPSRDLRAGTCQAATRPHSGVSRFRGQRTRVAWGSRPLVRIGVTRTLAPV